MREKIKGLAEQLRLKKLANAEKSEILNMIADLLELKFLDPDNHDDGCDPPKDFKLRWRVREKGGRERILQRPGLSACLNALDPNIFLLFFLLCVVCC